MGDPLNVEGGAYLALQGELGVDAMVNGPLMDFIGPRASLELQLNTFSTLDSFGAVDLSLSARANFLSTGQRSISQFFLAEELKFHTFKTDIQETSKTAQSFSPLRLSAIEILPFVQGGVGFSLFSGDISQKIGPHFSAFARMGLIQVAGSLGAVGISAHTTAIFSNKTNQTFGLGLYFTPTNIFPL